MLSKKRVFFIAIFFFLALFIQLKNVQAQYVCNQDCSLNPAGCNAPLICSGGLCRNPSCTSEVSCICPTPTPTPTTIPNPHWIKLKNTSFCSVNDLSNVIPNPVSSYDSDDNGARYFIISSASSDPGLVSAKSISLNIPDPSTKKWQNTLNKTVFMTPSDFYNYIKSRKDYKVIASLNEITTNSYDKQILVITGPLTVDNGNKSIFDNKNLVLIIIGDLNFSLTTFNPTTAHIAFLTTGTITYSNTVTEVHGIFVAPNIVTGTTANQGLKIVGNLAALTNLDNQRRWADSSIPAVFVVFDQSYYLNLIGLMSTANYDWSQTQ